MVRDLNSADGPVPILVSVKGDAVAAAASPLERVELDLTKFHNGRWALQLDTAMVHRRTPVVILAQGVACLAVAWWAQLSPRSYMENIRGGVFLSPLNVGFGQAAIARDVRGPATRLPFPSIVACDPSPAIEQVLALADAWGSRFVDAGAPQGNRQSNRSPIGSAVEERLVGLLGLLDGGSPTAPAEVIELAIPELAR